MSAGAMNTKSSVFVPEGRSGRQATSTLTKTSEWVMRTLNAVIRRPSIHRSKASAEHREAGDRGAASDEQPAGSRRMPRSGR